MFVFVPWNTRRKYSKYQNVGMWKSSNPIFPDIFIALKNERENKFRFCHHYDIGKLELYTFIKAKSITFDVF